MKTIMNLVGPLSNPAEARHQLIGVFAEALCRPVAEAARLLGVERAMVVHGLDGEDELSVTGPTRVVELQDGEIREYLFDPAHLGLPPYPLEALRLSSVQDNLAAARRILGEPDEAHGAPALAGELAESRDAAIRDAVALNAGAALYVDGRADSVEAGYRAAADALDRGAVRETLARVVEESRSLLHPASAQPASPAAESAPVPAGAAGAPA